jgi:hypothetical protein
MGSLIVTALQQRIGGATALGSTAIPRRLNSYISADQALKQVRQTLRRVLSS